MRAEFSESLDRAVVTRWSLRGRVRAAVRRGATPDGPRWTFEATGTPCREFRTVWSLSDDLDGWLESRRGREWLRRTTEATIRAEERRGPPPSPWEPARPRLPEARALAGGRDA